MENGLQKIYRAWEADPNRGVHGTERKVAFEDLASSIVALGPFYYYVLDFSDMSLSNVHPAISDILGLQPGKVQFSDVVGAFHPEDIDNISRMEWHVGQYFHKHIHPQKLLRYKASYNFRMRTKDGSYALFNHQALMLSLGPDGGYGKAINIHTRIDHLTSVNNWRFSVIGLDGEPSFLNIATDVGQSQPLRFSAKETQVIRLLSDGLDSDAVAAKLFISPHTVKKHRKNILQKSGCANVAQLIKMCVMEGLV